MNTGGNAIIKQLADMAGQAEREEIGLLIEGETIKKVSMSSLHIQILRILLAMYGALCMQLAI